jgi:hypothetical protein
MVEKPKRARRPCEVSNHWGHAKEKNCIFPVAYLRKPKWMDEESWKKVVDCIELKMPNETFLSYNAEVTHD